MAKNGFSDAHLITIREYNQLAMQRCSYINRRNIAYIFEQIAFSKPLVTLLIYLCLNTSCAKAVPLQSGNFKCGELMCDRFGFDACITENDELYCMPCSHEYLASTCGTQNEQPGCNVYCTEKAVEREKEILTSNYTKQLIDMSKQAEFSKKKNILQISRNKSLEKNIDNKNLIINILAGAIIFVILAAVICTVMTYRSKTKSETSETKSLIKEDEDDNATHRNDLPDTKIETNINGAGEQTSLKLKFDQCKSNSQEDECPAMSKFSSMSPTNTDGNDKLAITKFDHSQSKQTIV